MRKSRLNSWRTFDPSAIRVRLGNSDRSPARPVILDPNVVVRILGLDPGSRYTGFGIIECQGSRTRYIASGAISAVGEDFAGRLQTIFTQVRELIMEYRPAEIAIERVFMNKNPDSALKLGQARGAALCAAFEVDARIFEYTPREVKMTVVGTGGADKQQVQHMVKALLSLNDPLTSDASDALAIALCHSQGRQMRALLEKTAAP